MSNVSTMSDVSTTRDRTTTVGPATKSAAPALAAPALNVRALRDVMVGVTSIPCEREPVVRPTHDSPEDFDDFVRHRRHELVRYASLLAGSVAQGEDLVQDVLLRTYAKWHELDDPLPYVRRGITNGFLSWRRRWATRHIRPAGDELPETAVDVAWDTGPDPELWAALASLTPKQRAAIVLRFYEDLTDDESARVLGCQAATVRTHVSRGLAALRVLVTDTTEKD